MNKEVLKEPIFVQEIVDIIKASLPEKELRERLGDYHDNDIAQMADRIVQIEDGKILIGKGDKESVESDWYKCNKDCR